jgi:hypothetical protein
MPVRTRPIRTLIAALVAVPCAIALVPALLAALLVAGFAAGVRKLGRVLEPSFVPWTELIMFDRHLGWKPRPDLDCHYLADGDDVHRIVTDGEGWPGRRAIGDSDVLVVGDSFAFGYGVDTGRSFAEVVPGLAVKAVGAPGYSMVQGVLLMEQFAERLRGKLVVWFVYLENDLQDNLLPEMRRYRAPFARFDAGRHAWTIAGDHVTSAPWEASDLDKRRLFPRFCVPGPLADRAYAACEFLLERAVVCCRRAGGHLVVLTIPHPMQLTEQGRAQLAALSGAPDACDAALPDQRLSAICEKLDVPMLAGRSFLSHQDYKHREGIHWNEGGHRRVAQLLQALHRSHASGAPPERAVAVAFDHRSPVAPRLEQA